MLNTRLLRPWQNSFSGAVAEQEELCYAEIATSAEFCFDSNGRIRSTSTYGDPPRHDLDRAAEAMRRVIDVGECEQGLARAVILFW